jgi:GT2 family glycosyltransferase
LPTLTDMRALMRDLAAEPAHSQRRSNLPRDQAHSLESSEAQEQIATTDDMASRLRDSEEERAEILNRLQFASLSQQHLEQRILALENSFVSRCFRSLGRVYDTTRARLAYKLANSRFNPYYLKLRRTDPRGRLYRQWAQLEEACAPSPEWHRQQAHRWHYRPLVSIVTPVHNPKRQWLDAAVSSVVGQTYDNWELCVCDDASREEWVAKFLDAKAKADSRIRVVGSNTPIGISGALNLAGSLARGEYVGFLDHDDLLSPYALHYVVEALQDSNFDLIYTDEDIVNEQGNRILPNFKPGWSPELLAACMYINHFMVVSRRRLDQVGWFRSECDGAQDYDLALRLSDLTPSVQHLPRVLYHWRRHEGSSIADSSAKPYTHNAGRRALADALERRGQDAEVEDGPRPNTYHLKYRPSRTPLVSLIVCSRRHKLLRRCLSALKSRTDYPNREIIVVEHSGDDEAIEKLIERFACRRVVYSAPFNFSSMNNSGVAVAEGEVLVLLNDDVKPLDSRWLGYLVSQLERPEVGVVGAKLLYPSGAIQHAGLVIDALVGAAHPGRGSFTSGYWPWLDLTRDVSAVTGACLAIRKDLFERVGGLDPSFPMNYNDVDLCLRVRQLGFRVVYEARAVLCHYEASTRAPGIGYKERESFFGRWPESFAKGDQYYNPNLTAEAEVLPDLEVLQRRVSARQVTAFSGTQIARS